MREIFISLIISALTNISKLISNARDTFVNVFKKSKLHCAIHNVLFYNESSD